MLLIIKNISNYIFKIILYKKNAPQKVGQTYIERDYSPLRDTRNCQAHF